LGLLPIVAVLLPGAVAGEKDLDFFLTEGLEAYRAGNLQKAREAWSEGLRLAQEQGDDLFLGSFHDNLGIISSVSGDHTQAAAHFEKAIRIAHETGDRQGLKNRLNNAGGLYLVMGEPDKALERFSEALEISRTLGDERLEASVLANMGEAYLMKGAYREAGSRLREAFPLLKDDLKQELEGKVLSNLGQMYASMGNYPQALNHFRSAISHGQAREDSPAKSAALIRDYNRMGVLTRDLGDPLGAAAFHQSAAEQAKAAKLADQQRASEQLAAEAMGSVDGKPETLRRLRLEGFTRMLERLRLNKELALATQVEEQVRKLEKDGRLDSAGP
jgi:tetratricopeptide (TPR) repeat protein